MSESRQVHQHQRSSSTGSHGLFFSTVSHPLSHGVNPIHHQTSSHHKGHHVLHHQASGSPDLLSDLSDDEESNESCTAPELQGNFKIYHIIYFYRNHTSFVINIDEKCILMSEIQF